MASELNQQKQPDLDSVRQFLASAQLLGLMQCSADEWFMGDETFIGDSGMNTKEIEDLIEERIQARAEKNYSLADDIRAKLESNGILLEDTGGKTLWKKR